MAAFVGGFVIGGMIGGTVGFLIAATLTMAKHADKQEEDHDRRRIHLYRLRRPRL